MRDGALLLTVRQEIRLRPSFSLIFAVAGGQGHRIVIVTVSRSVSPDFPVAIKV
jgi:hypothetical protein